MNQCPECKSTLNNDEKASGKCFTCGAAFESELAKTATGKKSGNMIGKVLKTVGILIVVCGTIWSFIACFGDRYSHNKILCFLLPEAASIAGGLAFLGLSEIIFLLQSINDKLK